MDDGILGHNMFVSITVDPRQKAVSRLMDDKVGPSCDALHRTSVGGITADAHLPTSTGGLHNVTLLDDSSIGECK